MKRVWRFVRRWWWAFLVGLATILGAVAAILLRPKRNIDPSPEYIPPKTFRDQAQEQVERVRLEGEIERARITERAETHREELDEIETIGKNDPAEGRRQLARWLQGNL
jgi:hypothetical protein